MSRPNKPDITPAVEDQLAYADVYNENFQKMFDYIDDNVTYSSKLVDNMAETKNNLPIGAVFSLCCSSDYIPEGCLPCDGSEYSMLDFQGLWDNYLAGDNPLLLTCTYEAYANNINTYGQCAKFAVDATNFKFKVPTIKDGATIQQAKNNAELGKSYNAGLPNITGNTLVDAWSNFSDSTTSPSGAFAINGGVASLNGGGNNTLSVSSGDFDASRSSSVYGNSSTVQPVAVALRYFVVVANGQINRSQIDWNQFVTSKADLSLNNLDDNGKAKFDSPWVSCDEYQVFNNVGLSSSTYSEYTLDFLPDNGVFELSCAYMANAGTNNGYVRLKLADESESYSFVVGANTGTASNPFIYGQATLIISNKKIKAMRIAGGNGNEKFSLTAVVYRKLGSGFETTT